MTIPNTVLRDAATRLHGYLLRAHWNTTALEGPDAGIRLNWRVGRFIKSYTPFLPWSDRLAYLQAQGYWILDNWLMADVANTPGCDIVARACTEYVIAQQRPEGYWEYPNPEWKGRIATVEGDYATLGLLDTYKRTRDPRLLVAARKWYDFLVDRIGFHRDGTGTAVYYFAGVKKGLVPNNSTLTLRTLARLAEATGDDRYLAHGPGLIAWLGHVQTDSGEMPYVVEHGGAEARPHFLCFQYNAFQFLDLADYYDVTADSSVIPILASLARFIATGTTASGAAAFNCHKTRPEVTYYTAVVAAALARATSLGLGDHGERADSAYRRLLAEQMDSGNLRVFSRGNYGLLSDRRPYPRNLAMILYHLLHPLASATRERSQSGCLAYTT